jgi:hypothetical protein
MQKKNLFFSVAVFFVFVLRKTHGKITTQGMPLPEVTYWEKTVSSDVSGNYLVVTIRKCKYLFPALVFNLLIR